jgi:hypothetical protein
VAGLYFPKSLQDRALVGRAWTNLQLGETSFVRRPIGGFVGGLARLWLVAAE